MRCLVFFAMHSDILGTQLYKSTDAKLDRARIITILSPLLVVPDDITLAGFILARLGDAVPRATLGEGEFKRLFDNEHGAGLRTLLEGACPRAEELLDWAKAHLMAFCRGCL